MFCHVQLPLLSFALAQSVSIIFPAPRNNNLTNVYHDSNKHNSNYDNNYNNNLTGPAIATTARFAPNYLTLLKAMDRQYEHTVHAIIACSEFDPILIQLDDLLCLDSCALMLAYKGFARPTGSPAKHESMV